MGCPPSVRFILLLLAMPAIHSMGAAQTPSPRILLDSPTPAPAQAPAKPAPIRVNGLLYTPPTQHDLIAAYVQDTYGIPGQARTAVRALYSFARGGPPEWDQNAAGFGIRMASNEGITIISGNVRLGMEEIFHEDLRYIPCRGCRKRDKLANALLAEITARHDRDGHRFFTLTPTVSDFSGPLLAHVLWYPSVNPYDGFISARTVFATRIGGHLVREFILDRKKHKPRPGERVDPTE